MVSLPHVSSTYYCSYNELCIITKPKPHPDPKPIVSTQDY